MSTRFDLEASGLPSGWVVTQLETLLREPLRNGKSAKASANGNGVRTLTLTAVTQGKFSDENTKLTVADPADVTDLWLEPGDVLIQRSNTPDLVGTAAMFRGPRSWAVFPDLLIRVRPNGAVSPAYIESWLRSSTVRQYFRDAARGIAGSMPKISQSTIGETPVALAPLPEQHRIVAEIEKHFTRLDDAVATLKRVQAELERARASVLKAAVEGRLVPTEAELARAEGRTYEPASVLLERILEKRKRRHEEANGKKKYKPPVEPETEGLPELPEGWVWTTVDQLAREKLRNGKSARAIDGSGGVRTLTLSAVTERSFIEANTKLTVATPEQVSGLWLEPGDILVQRSNTPDLVGTAALYSGPSNWAVFPDLLIRVRPSSEVMPAWVEYVLRTPRVRQFFKQRAQGIAGTMPKIDQETVARAVVPLPPKQEQHRIVAEVSRRLSVFDALAQTVHRNLSRCTHLRQAILKRAFSGKLVPQDPNDEPASALLARIRATAAAQQP